MTLRVRDLHEGEAEDLGRMTRSRTLGVGLVRRAQIVQHAVEGLSPPEIAARLAVCKASVRFWLKRFNARGLPGLKEEMRSGRPPTPLHPTPVLSSVLTTWDRKPARAIPADAQSSRPGHGRNGPNRKSTWPPRRTRVRFWRLPPRQRRCTHRHLHRPHHRELG